MVITEDFVYIHLPKTGGTFVARVLRRLLNDIGAWYLDTSRGDHRAILGTQGKHQSVREIPPEHRGKPVLFTIRDPYDWYVSQYEFAWWKVEPKSEFDDQAIRSRYGSYPDLTFAEFVAAVNDWRLWPVSDRDRAAPIEQAGEIGLYTSMFVRALTLSSGHAFAAAQQDGSSGLAAALYPRIDFLRTDRLNQELHHSLVRLGFPPAEIGFVIDAEPIGRRGSGAPLAPGEQARNTAIDSEGGHDPAIASQEYYDQPLKTFIREREHMLFELFPDFDA